MAWRRQGTASRRFLDRCGLVARIPAPGTPNIRVHALEAELARPQASMFELQACAAEHCSPMEWPAKATGIGENLPGPHPAAHASVSPSSLRLCVRGEKAIDPLHGLIGP